MVMLQLPIVLPWNITLNCPFTTRFAYYMVHSSRPHKQHYKEIALNNGIAETFFVLS